MKEVLAQNKALRQYLEKGGRVTLFLASILFGIGHLPRRIKDLKDIYHLHIDGDWINVRKANGKIARVKEYYLKDEKNVK
jgi:hypothetical protein